MKNKQHEAGVRKVCSCESYAYVTDRRPPPEPTITVTITPLQQQCIAMALAELAEKIPQRAEQLYEASRAIGIRHPENWTADAVLRRSGE